MAVQYAPTKLRVPPGFQNILEGFAREVLREQPEDIIQFGAQYFKTQLSVREETGKDDAKRGENLEKLQQGDDVDIDIGDPEVQAAATKIQASFRGHKVREEAKQKKEEESAALTIQSSFRGHKARQDVKELKETKSKESLEGTPAPEGTPVLETEPEKPEEIDIDLNDPDVSAAALKIQASFRGHKARASVQKIKSPESVTTPDEAEGGKVEAEETEKPADAEAKEEDVPSEEPKEDPSQEVKESSAEQADDIDIDLNDPDVSKAATKIQATFRGHKTRKEIQEGSTPSPSQESLKTTDSVEQPAAEQEVASDSQEAAPETAGDQAAEAEPAASEDAQAAPSEGQEPAQEESTDTPEVAPEASSEAQETAEPEVKEADAVSESAPAEAEKETSDTPQGDDEKTDDAPQGDGKETDDAPQGDEEKADEAPQGEGESVSETKEDES